MHKCNLNKLKLHLIDFKIPKYSTIIIHSSLFKFGVIPGGINNIIRMLEEIFDDTYTIVVPTFTFQFSSTQQWSYTSSKSETGVLCEQIRKQNNALRSIHPFHSIAAYGPNAEYLTNSICESSFGVDSPFEKLYKLKGYNLSLGSEFEGGATFCHYAEELLNVPYRVYKNFPGEVRDRNDKIVSTAFSMYVRQIEKDYEYINRWDIMWNDVLRNNLVEYSKFDGIAPVFLMNVVDSHDFLYEKILKNQYYVAEKIKR